MIEIFIIYICVEFKIKEYFRYFFNFCYDLSKEVEMMQEWELGNLVFGFSFSRIYIVVMLDYLVWCYRIKYLLIVGSLIIKCFIFMLDFIYSFEDELCFRFCLFKRDYGILEFI